MSVAVEENEQGIVVVLVHEGYSSNGPTKTYVDEETVADLLGYAAADMDGYGCKKPFCAYCNPARSAWWRACNSLSTKTRRGLQALMRDAGVALPEAPYEDVDDNAVPAAQHG